MRGAVGVAGSSVVCSERPERGGAVRATLRLQRAIRLYREFKTGNGNYKGRWN